MTHWHTGLALLENWIDHAAESRIIALCIAALDAGPCQTGSAIGGRRRVVRFGAYQGDATDVPMPSWLVELAFAVRECRPAWTRRNSVAINEYLAGDSIATHCDSFQYGDGIATLSVGAAARFVLTRDANPSPWRSGGETLRIEVPPRSLLVLERDAHWKCQHGIDAWAEQPAPRYSMVFRERVFR